MTCTIKWNLLKLSEWTDRFNQIRRSNILQSYPYAQAQSALRHQRPRWGLIEINGATAGLVQILEAGLFKNIIHAVIIDQGPLWFDGYGTVDHLKAFAVEINRQFPSRVGRRRRFIPNIENSPLVRPAMEESGFKSLGSDIYKTIWLDLTQSEDALRKNLKSGWRGSLRKAEKQNLTIEWNDAGVHFPWLLTEYMIDKKQKNYDGPSAALLKSLARYFIPEKKMIIGRALIDGKPIAGILLLCHGRCATYQIGWSSLEGRETAAHHKLLWDVLRILKDKNIKDFDLGGVNDDSAKGVKQFKAGMGGALVHLSGLYS